MAGGGIVAFDDGGEVPGYAGGGKPKEDMDRYKQAIIDEAQLRGISPALALQISGVESQFDKDAKPIDPKTGKPRSSATSFFQLIDSTFKGLGGDPNKRNDPMENIRVGVESLVRNQKSLTTSLGRDPTPAEMYTAHFLGTGTGTRLLSADPNMSVKEFLTSVSPKKKQKGVPTPEEIIAANPEVLGGTKKVGDVLAFTQQKMAPLSAALIPTANAATPTATSAGGVKDLVSQIPGANPNLVPRKSKVPPRYWQ